MQWLTNLLSCSLSDWCNSQDKLTVTYECIDGLITSAVAVCLTDVIRDYLTVAEAALGDLTELFPIN